MRAPTAPLSVLAVLVLAALGPPAPVAAQASPAAYLVRVQGELRVVRADGSTDTAVVGQALSIGDRVVPAEGSRAILLTAAGAQRMVTAPFTVDAPATPARADLFSRTVSVLAQAGVADQRAAGGRMAAVRPMPGGPAVVAPRGQVTLTSTRPTFSWLEETPGAGFTVLVQRAGATALRFDASDAMTREDTCRFLDATDAVVEVVCYRSSWTLPGDVPALVPGAEYTWRVVPAAGRPSGGGSFRVSGSEAYASLHEGLMAIAELGLDPSGDGLFLTIPVYRELGLSYDALAALTALERSGAMSSDLYRLKGEILLEVGMQYEAREAFRRADERR